MLCFVQNWSHDLNASYKSLSLPPWLYMFFTALAESMMNLTFLFLSCSTSSLAVVVHAYNSLCVDDFPIRSGGSALWVWCCSAMWPPYPNAPASVCRFTSTLCVGIGQPMGCHFKMCCGNRWSSLRASLLSLV